MLAHQNGIEDIRLGSHNDLRNKIIIPPGL